MQIGLLKEIKPTEKRVLLVPEAVRKLIKSGHQIMVETGAGENAGFSDLDYEGSGAKIIPTSEKIFKLSQFILKVHPPMPIELELFKKDHISFSFLTIANHPEKAESLLKQESVFFSAELVEDNEGKFPVLGGMSEIAAQMALIQAGKYLEKVYGGKGILLHGITGLNAPKVTIVGAGLAGKTITKMALSLGIEVNITDIDKKQLADVAATFQSPNLHIFPFTPKEFHNLMQKSDVLISAVLNKGKKAPMIASEEDVRAMAPGSVIIDLAIDHGGSIETSRPTTHDDPIYLKHEIIHYCVPNMPSALPKTSSEVLSRSVLPFIKKIADIGFEEAITYDSTLKKGLTFYHGKVVNSLIADSLGYEYYEILELLELNI